MLSYGGKNGFYWHQVYFFMYTKSVMIIKTFHISQDDLDSTKKDFVFPTLQNDIIISNNRGKKRNIFNYTFSFSPSPLGMFNFLSENL